MTKEQMMNEIIKTRGFEDEITIWFCKLCEENKLSEERLKDAMIASLVVPIF